MTVGEYLRHWLDASARTRVRPSTYAGYERLIRVQLTPRLGTIPLQKLTPLHIQDAYTAMLASPCASTRHNTLSNRTVRYADTVLKMALKQAVRWHLVVGNAGPAKGRPAPCRGVECTGSTAALQDDNYNPLWLLALATGMRLGELRGLRWCDVELARGVLHVRQQLTRVGRKDTTSEPKTHAGRRTITLPRDAIEALTEHHARRLVRPIPSI